MVGGGDRNVRRGGGRGRSQYPTGGGGDRNIRIIDAPPPIEPPLVVTNWLISFEIQGY